MAVSSKRRAASSSAASDLSPSPSAPPRPAKKAGRPAVSTLSSNFPRIFDHSPKTTSNMPASVLPARTHTPSYHRPLLLEQPDSIASLLTWFDGVSSKRDMPWRASFVDPSDSASLAELREVYKKRAYQVWISEIMLQQTRVETVKSYWVKWMTKWPTIEDLAFASEEDVLAAWRGLGYYSRATRIHTAAKKVVNDPTMNGLLPDTPTELETNVPGVGPYTAGAISSIVFGKPVPILDGNVARVLSRQLALYANPKAKLTTDLMWAAADVLVKKAYEVGGEKGTVPGEWNQGLMELGSTLCTPLKPKCEECPIQQSCRAYQEADADTANGMGKQGAAVADLEDLCTLCEPFPFEEAAQDVSKHVEEEEWTKQKGLKRLRQATLPFGFPAPVSKTKPKMEQAQGKLTMSIERHVCKYPMKVEKKKIRQEECLVCIVANDESRYLLEQRPSTGLLASMWQFPSLTTSTTAAGPSSEESVKLFPCTPLPKLIDSFVASLLETKAKTSKKEWVGSITHIFSHLHLTMHVYKVALPTRAEAVNGTIQNVQDGPSKLGKTVKTEQVAEKNKNFGSKLGDAALRRWADADEVEAETMGTGMRNCWVALQMREKQLDASSKSTKTAGTKRKTSKS
ncbi:related to A/G-specific adenine DNA glycosylase [Melanopsichium pennsylvanicum]|uniref:Adenine DNA glycosylase n=2 Tax=Melanopsichium pennsylvanicum TaxID=63383 RepID=A0AAJ4XNX0_9BASI|nr:related to A/G-specific adenine DNA glycosylase [Melanopsichium pennsylvanicum 4]SNX85780.1 related to A/G-specific adenine DNA glycosylase [Melanopsichium pennsylvanicum]